MIRQKIVACFKGTGTEPSMDEVATHLGVTESELRAQLKNEPPLTEVYGLSMVELQRVMRQFGELGIFSSDIVKAILEFTESRLAETHKKIKEIEQKAKGRKPPGSS